jgi:hypothetical protein
MKRANTDREYLKQLSANPVGVLVEEGLPYDIIEDFLRETDLQGEVSGYAMLECANSCALTNPNAYPEELRYFHSK